jgi:GR25 family glycosyltransferase involved in LPS biosynthesis
MVEGNALAAFQDSIAALMEHTPPGEIELRLGFLAAEAELHYTMGLLCPDGAVPEWQQLPDRVERFSWKTARRVQVWAWLCPETGTHAEQFLPRLVLHDVPLPTEYAVLLASEVVVEAGWWEALRPVLEQQADYVGQREWHEYVPAEMQKVQAHPLYMGVPFDRRGGRPGVSFLSGGLLAVRAQRLRETNYPQPGRDRSLTGKAGDRILLGEIARQQGWKAAEHVSRVRAPAEAKPAQQLHREHVTDCRPEPWQVHYINLSRRPDRQEQFLRQDSASLNFTRVEAVDGNALQVENLVKEGLLAEPLRAYTLGAIGNALSHRGLWDRCVSSGRFMTIAEDDAVFNVSFARAAPRLIEGLPADWDIILWGWNFDSILEVEFIEGLTQTVMTLAPQKLREKVEAFRRKVFSAQALRLIHAFGTVCYSISPKGAEQLRRRCFPLKNETVRISGLQRSLLNFSLDTAMNAHYRQMKAYVSFPPLVWTENDKDDSDVAASRSDTKR